MYVYYIDKGCVVVYYLKGLFWKYNENYSAKIQVSLMPMGL